MTALADVDAATIPLAPSCGYCNFSFKRTPELTEALRDASTSYEQVGYALTDAISFLSPSPGPWSALDYLIHVRDGLHEYTDRLSHFVKTDDRGSEAIELYTAQAYSLDYMGVMVGLAANAERLVEVIEEFPAALWDRSRTSDGRRLRVIELANYAVHEAVHHLVDLDLLYRQQRGLHHAVRSQGPTLRRS
ncbi:MAG: DinB family protein [Acidimicrobiales bacterium]